MIIESIIIKNFKIYYKENFLKFSTQKNKNVFIISGHNGYGKTTFLSSLVWCLYGKNIKDVDGKFRKEIFEKGGYKNFLSQSLNRIAKAEGDTNFSVTLNISGVYFPSAPNSKLEIFREFSSETGKETFKILIDGKENELTKEVGPEVFVNDFILPKEIARFFFFDSEKIVEFAEINSIEDKRKLSKAYLEVLGVKKYKDLIDNLRNVSYKLKKIMATDSEIIDIEHLEQEEVEINNGLDRIKTKIEQLGEEKELKKGYIHIWYEKLLREGNLYDLKSFERSIQKKEELSLILKKLQKEMKHYLDLAPFAIAFNVLDEARNKIEKESISKKNHFDSNHLKEKLKGIKNKLADSNLLFSFSPEEKKVFIEDLSKLILEDLSDSSDIVNLESVSLFGFNIDEEHKINSIHYNISVAFGAKFKILSERYKDIKLQIVRLNRFINETERKESNPIVKDIRNKINLFEEEVAEIDNEIFRIKLDEEFLKRDLIKKNKQLNELTKKIKLDSINTKKELLAERLDKKITKFLGELIRQKKEGLEKKLLNNLMLLLHKTNFVLSVKVHINTEIVDIELLDKDGNVIPKDSLSKGEQQLYATALLKSLVEESNLQFPVFIDSPLQKFDHKHTKNIINKFYPKISTQVVLFPLLDKEINKDEYDLLKDKIIDTYVIDNISSEASQINKIDPETLYSHFFNNSSSNVQIN